MPSRQTRAEQLGNKSNKIDRIDRHRLQLEKDRKKEEKDRKKDEKVQKRIAKRLDDLKATFNKIEHELEMMKSQNKRLEAHLVEIDQELSTAPKDRTISTSNEDVVAIVDNGSIYIPADSDSEDSEQVPPHESSVIRAAKGNVSAMFKRIVKEYPEAEIIYRFDNPNAVMSWERYLERYGKNLIKSGCKFSFVEGYTRARFLRHLKRCENEKMKDVE